MRHTRPGHRISRFGMALGGCALAFAMMSGPVRAKDDGDDNLFHELTSLIGIDAEKSPDSDYHDRAPLVLPPKNKAAALPKPQATTEKSNPAWPNDPDVARVRKEAELARAPNLFDPHKPQPAQDRDARLASRVAGSEPQVPQPDNAECNIKHCPPSKAQIEAVDKALSGLTADKKYAIGEEPQREWLTEPPKGYRKRTQSADDTPEQIAAKSDSNPLMFWKRWTSSSSE